MIGYARHRTEINIGHSYGVSMGDMAMFFYFSFTHSKS